MAGEGHLLARCCPGLCCLFYFGIFAALFAAFLYFKIMSISFEREYSAHCPMAQDVRPGHEARGSGVSAPAAKGRAFKLIVC